VFSVQTALYISAWAEMRRPAAGVGTLFLSFQHQTMGTALTREGVQGMCKKWGAKLGIKLSPHDFRRSFATLSTIFGAPSRVVQVAGRWSDIEMVERYTREITQSEIEDYLPVQRLSKLPL
jgi:integrase